MKQKTWSEAQVAEAVVTWLVGGGWSVYQEVSTGQSYPVADIVAVKEDVSWIIETKTGMSLQLLDQAMYWCRDWSTLVSVAIPVRVGAKRRVGGRAAETLLKHKGIGLIEVGEGGRWEKHGRVSFPEVKEYGVTIEASMAVGNQKIRDYLVEAQKDFAPAGNCNGKRWTPFAQTCMDLRNVVAGEPGIALSDAVKRIETHYSTAASAVSNLGRFIQSGVVKGLEAKLEGRRLVLYLKELAAKSG